MNAIKLFFIFWVALFLTGCASIDPHLFQNTLADNPTIDPQALQTSLKLPPIIDKQSSSIRYQVYKVGFFNTLNAVYFKNGQMVRQSPYSATANLEVLLQLGAGPDDLKALLQRPPDEDQQIRTIRYQVYKTGFFSAPQVVYFKGNQMVTLVAYDPYANLKMLFQLGAISQQEYDKKSYCVGDTCTCLVPVDCNGVCGGSATLDACGYCNGSVLSCSYPDGCFGDSCSCAEPVDCAGTCGGSAKTDCAGICNGSTSTDICGVCGGNGSSCAPPSTI